MYLTHLQHYGIKISTQTDNPATARKPHNNHINEIIENPFTFFVYSTIIAVVEIAYTSRNFLRRNATLKLFTNYMIVPLPHNQLQKKNQVLQSH
jgi:Na+/alanine symporter